MDAMLDMLRIVGVLVGLWFAMRAVAYGMSACFYHTLVRLLGRCRDEFPFEELPVVLKVERIVKDEFDQATVVSRVLGIPGAAAWRLVKEAQQKVGAEGR